MKKPVFTLIMAVLFLLTFFPALSFADEDEKEEEKGDSGERDDSDDEDNPYKDTKPETEPPVKEAPPPAPETFTRVYSADPHWMNAFWRSGIGSAGGNMTLKYRNAPPGLEDEFEAEADGFGDIHESSFWFYPAKGRSFLISVGIGGGSSNGHFYSESRKSEFLDAKEYWTSFMVVPLGLGYRWLVGTNDRVSINLKADAIWVTQGLHLEGAGDSVALNGFGAGLFFGAHYRYDSGYLLGGAMELRSSDQKHTDTEILDEMVDVKFHATTFTLGVIIGWEPRYVYQASH